MRRLTSSANPPAPLVAAHDRNERLVFGVSAPGKLVRTKTIRSACSVVAACCRTSAPRSSARIYSTIRVYRGPLPPGEGGCREDTSETERTHPAARRTSCRITWSERVWWRWPCVRRPPPTRRSFRQVPFPVRRAGCLGSRGHRVAAPFDAGLAVRRG